MIEDVAKAICEAAGRTPNGDGPVCIHCHVATDGKRECLYWEVFKVEARDAIFAAYYWHKRERRWPSFVK